MERRMTHWRTIKHPSGCKSAGVSASAKGVTGGIASGVQPQSLPHYPHDTQRDSNIVLLTDYRAFLVDQSDLAAASQRGPFLSDEEFAAKGFGIACCLSP